MMKSMKKVKKVKKVKKEKTLMLNLPKLSMMIQKFLQEASI
jgi:hypothetical protein